MFKDYLLDQNTHQQHPKILMPMIFHATETYEPLTGYLSYFVLYVLEYTVY